jgi:prepilin-type N-terminal cleavage/methylation domain-containing protein
VRIRSTHTKAFTLIELLMVVVVVAVLAALLLPVLMSAQRTARNAQVSADMSTMSQALASFRTRHGDYPPSRIWLSETGVYDLSDPAANAAMVVSANGTAGTDITVGELKRRSLSALRKFWPRMALSTTSALPPGINAKRWYDFDGDGAVASGPYILEGDECLTFFLGGVPLNTGDSVSPVWSMSGWGKDPSNPFSNNLANSNPMYSGNRTVPLFEFVNGRLRDMDPAAGDSVRFPCYIDPLGSDAPYAYFSAYGSEGYDPNDVNVPEADDAGAGPMLRQFRVAGAVVDSAGADAKHVAISAPPNPYTSSDPGAATVQWHKGQTFQLLSAGRDGQWGHGGRYDASGTRKLPPNPAAQILPDIAPELTDDRPREKDNVTSFSGGPLD